MNAWICDHNGRWGRSEDTVWETGTLRMLVRKWNAERERDDITHTHRWARKEKPAVPISVILLMRWQAVVLAAIYGVVTSVAADCCGRAVIKHVEILIALQMHWGVQVWKLAIRSKGAPFAVTLETSSGLWSFFVLRCLSETSLFDKRVRRWGKNGKNQSVRLWPAVG